MVLMVAVHISLSLATKDCIPLIPWTLSVVNDLIFANKIGVGEYIALLWPFSLYSVTVYDWDKG